MTERVSPQTRGDRSGDPQISFLAVGTGIPSDYVSGPPEPNAGVTCRGNGGHLCLQI